MPLSFLLILEVLSLILTCTPGEAVVYYVTPTEPPNPDCPGQPCQTLDYYFSHKEEYFNSSKINVTMLLLGGEHILSWIDAECVDAITCGHLIKDLEIFEMKGLEQAYDVIVPFFWRILLKPILQV